MAMLNKTAAEALHKYTPNAVTDITGFGLLGHSCEMAKGSQVSFEIRLSSVPVLKGTLELAKKGVVPGGTKANHKWIQEDVLYEDITLEEQYILCDAITSGGLLVSMNEEDALRYLSELKALGLKDCAIIGKVYEKKEKCLYVKR